ncbi:histidine kinase dimerization/phospho-acceptor domain-containing protein, partial [Psychrobacter sp. 1U2]
HHNPLYAFQQALAHQHRALLNSCLSVPTNQSRNFVYELPEAATASITNKLRVQVIPLEDGSQLILLEDLRREQANAQQLKLASLGQLTASIAHEIRNPLAAISQASQLLLEDMNDVADADESHSQTAMNTSGNNELYKMIFAQTKRVNRIIEDVLKLSRQQRSNKQTIELGT